MSIAFPGAELHRRKGFCMTPKSRTFSRFSKFIEFDCGSYEEVRGGARSLYDVQEASFVVLCGLHCHLVREISFQKFDIIVVALDCDRVEGNACFRQESKALRVIPRGKQWLTVYRALPVSSRMLGEK